MTTPAKAALSIQKSCCHPTRHPHSLTVQPCGTAWSFTRKPGTPSLRVNFKNAVDLLFEELEQKNPNHFAVRQYKKYKLVAGKTAKSNLISCGARLAPFDIKELRDLTAYDELELDTLGEKKTALFILQENPSLHHCLAVNFQVLERTP